MKDAGRPSEGWRTLALAAAVVTTLLIVLGGWVRITGSGMGCGDHWPLCNGRLIPSLEDPATFIEWAHRLVAAAVSVLTAALAAWAIARRRDPAWSRRARTSVGAVGLLAIQVMLGAVTVWLELPAWSVVLHLGTAMAFLAILVLAALGAADPGATLSFRGSGAGAARMALWLTALSAVVVLLGALVANLGAAPACQGFPLCNGSLLPGGHWRIHLHWTHRVAAYALAVGAIGLPFVGRRPRPRTGWLVAGLTAAQIGVAAVMIVRVLPPGWRALHVALGAAVFAAFVAHAYLAGRVQTDSSSAT